MFLDSYGRLYRKPFIRNPDVLINEQVYFHHHASGMYDPLQFERADRNYARMMVKTNARWELTYEDDDFIMNHVNDSQSSLQ